MDDLNILRLILGTVFVLAILLFGAYILRKYAVLKGHNDGSTIRILTMRNLSPSHKLAVIEYGGKKLLVGYTRQFICKLDSIDLQPDAGFKAELLGQIEGSKDIKNNARPQSPEDRSLLSEMKQKVKEWKT